MATRTTPRRTTLGPHFSEGARLVWEGIEREGVSHADLRREWGVHTGDLSRALYGDRKRPSMAVLAGAQKRFGVPLEAWAQPPTVPFIPPAAREPEATKPAA